MIFYLLLTSGAILCAGILLMVWGARRVHNSQAVIEQAKQQISLIKKEGETERREALVKLKDELHRRRTDWDQELYKERGELDRAGVGGFPENLFPIRFQGKGCSLFS